MKGKSDGTGQDIKPQVLGAYDVRQALEEFVYRVITRMEIYSTVGVVSDIDENEYSCTVTPVDDSAAIYGVRLQASFSLGTGTVNIPKDKSNVIVTFLNKDTGFVSACSEVEKVITKTEDGGSVDFTVKDKGLYIDKNGIVANGGNDGGIPFSSKTATRLNNIENDINNLKTLISGWGPVSQDGGGALKIALAGWYGSPLSQTQQSDIANNEFKQ